MLTCCPVVVRPPCVWPRGSLPSFLSFALQLALDVQVTVGSLLPYGSQPSRWGHPCGVEAGVVLDRNEGLLCFSFPYGLILHVGVTLWVETVFDLILDRNVDFSVSPLGWFKAFTVASPIRGRVGGGLPHLFAPEASFLSLCHCPSGCSHPVGPVCWSVPTCTRPKVIISTSPYILPDGLRASV